MRPLTKPHCQYINISLPLKHPKHQKHQMQWRGSICSSIAPNTHDWSDSDSNKSMPSVHSTACSFRAHRKIEYSNCYCYWVTSVRIVTWRAIHAGRRRKKNIIFIIHEHDMLGKKTLKYVNVLSVATLTSPVASLMGLVSTSGWLITALHPNFLKNKCAEK